MGELVFSVLTGQNCQLRDRGGVAGVFQGALPGQRERGGIGAVLHLPSLVIDRVRILNILYPPGAVGGIGSVEGGRPHAVCRA